MWPTADLRLSCRRNKNNLKAADVAWTSEALATTALSGCCFAHPPFYEVPVVNPGGVVCENLNPLSVLSTLLSTGEVPLDCTKPVGKRYSVSAQVQFVSSP